MLYGKQCGGVCGRVGPVVSEVGSVCWDVDEEVSPQRNPNTLLGVVLQVRYDSPKTCQTLPVCLYHLPHTHAHTHDLWTPYADLPIVVDAFHAGWHDLSPRPSPAAHLQQPTQQRNHLALQTTNDQPSRSRPTITFRPIHVLSNASSWNCPRRSFCVFTSPSHAAEIRRASSGMRSIRVCERSWCGGVSNIIYHGVQ